MDLLKLDPMARKMRTHIDAFYKALEDNDAMNARSHINEITKYADFLRIVTPVSGAPEAFLAGTIKCFWRILPALMSFSSNVIVLLFIIVSN